MFSRVKQEGIVLALVSGLAAANPIPAVAQADVTGEPAALLSAFFGLDNDLPLRANMLCLGASGMDGMPVVFSRTVDPETLQAEDFRIITASGDERAPHCVTLRPAQDPGELRTVLLIGEFGNADDDPPATVHVVGDLLSKGTQSHNGERANFRGLQTTVIPLSATTHFLFDPLDLLSKLAALVPRPRVNLTRYHGVFAPNSKLRARLVPGKPRKKRTHKPDLSNPPSLTTQPEPPDPTRLTWAQRLKRAFEFDVTVCPLCGGTLRVISDITDPVIINKILSHIRQSRAPPAQAQKRASYTDSDQQTQASV